MRLLHGSFAGGSSCAVRFGWLGFAALTLGCGGSQKTASGNPTVDLKSQQSDLGAQFDRSRCDDQGKRVVSLDANGDGKPDVIKLYSAVVQEGRQTEQLVCKQTDLDSDGKVDLVEYYGPNGDLAMDEYSMNYSGKFSGRTFYQDGKKVRAEKDMDFNGKPDHFEIYEGGKLVRVEADRNGDGRIDEWQYYEGGQLDRVGYDRTGSGRADTWERSRESGGEVPVAREGGASAANSATPPAPAAAAKPAPKAPTTKK